MVHMGKDLTRWATIVNKTLLELAKALNLPLSTYPDGTVLLQPSFKDGSFIPFSHTGRFMGVAPAPGANAAPPGMGADNLDGGTVPGQKA